MERVSVRVRENALERPRVLVVDDEPGIVRMLARLLESDGLQVLQAGGADELDRLLVEQPEVVLLDLQLGPDHGLELLGRIQQRSPDSEALIMTGHASIDSAVEAMRAGAFDYFEKPFADPQRIVQAVRRALERRALRVRNRELEGELEQRSVLERIVCQSRPMRQVLDLVRSLSRSDTSVLIEAESGTGKELLARAIHETSGRRTGPFVAVDCAALPEGIAEGELFGYERGAFTGAIRPVTGLFRSAQGGTLLLDEIGELPLPLQAKLLRVLQEREVRPLGSDRTLAVDVRIIAATNRSLRVEVEAGRFRADLYYRLRVVAIELPPLRERVEDIPALVAHFLGALRGSPVHGIEPAAMDLLLAHRWPGNVRELQNTIEAAAALAHGPVLQVRDLAHLRQPASAPHPLQGDIELSLEAYERTCLDEALRRSDGCVRQAALLLGVGRSTLYRKLAAHGIAVGPQVREGASARRDS